MLHSLNNQLCYVPDTDLGASNTVKKLKFVPCVASILVGRDGQQTNKILNRG